MSPAPQEVTRDELKDDGAGGAVVVSDEGTTPSSDGITGASHIPLRLKIIAVLLVSAIGFGAHWSSGVTGAMKSTLKKVCCWKPKLSI